MSRAHDLNKRCLIVTTLALSVLSASCKAPTEAKAGSCGGGSESLSVVPRHNELDMFATRTPTELRRLTGVGGCLTYRKPMTSSVETKPIKVCDFEQVHKPIEQRFPMCIAHFRKHGEPADNKQRLVVWTSRNCIDYADANAEFFIEFFNDGKPIKVQVPRMRWPANVRTQLATNQNEAIAIQNGTYRGVSAFADVHNFERLIIEVPLEQWNPATSSTAANKAQSLGQRLQEIFDDQSKLVAEIRSRQTENTQLLQKWLLLTEKQSLLRVMQAASQSTCASADSSACKAQLEKDLTEEFVAGLQYSGLASTPAEFRNIWYERSRWQNITKALETLALERQALFAELFNRVKGVSNPSETQSSQRVNSSVTFSGGTVEDLALLHGYRRDADDNGVSDEISYQGLPMSYLFKLDSNMAPNDRAPRGITFSPKVKFGPNDEGQMISLFGIAPVAFVSSKDVQLGKFTGRMVPAPSKGSAEVYAATGCR
jgi:hypothetical protein